MKLVTRHPVIDTPEYTCVLDEFETNDGKQMLLVHLDVHKHSKAIFMRLLDHWEKLRSVLTVPLFAYGEHDDDKYEHFIRHLGFQQISSIPCTDGQTRRVFVSYPKVSHAAEDNDRAGHEQSIDGLAVVPANSVSGRRVQ